VDDLWHSRLRAESIARTIRTWDSQRSLMMASDELRATRERLSDTLS
jgi:hypothetical protein